MADSLNDPLLKSAPSSASDTPPSSTATGAAGAATGTTSSAATSSPRSGTDPGPRRKQSTQDQLNETVQMVKDYARQETLDPLKTAGRWIGLGLVGSVLIGMATFFLSLGLLRLVQTEFPDAFEGRWMKLVPYLFALLLCVLVAGLALSRINKQPLTKEKR